MTEDKIDYYKEEGLLLTDIYRRDVVLLAKRLYPNIPEDKLNEFVNVYIEKNKRELIVKTRNVYERREGELDLNSVLKDTIDDGRIIGANGAIMKSQKEKKSKLTGLIKKFQSDRKIRKNAEIKAEESGNFDLARLFNALQNTIKAYLNSIYGLMTMLSSFFFNPDSSPLITDQSRNIISELKWGLEKFLVKNMPFSNFNEVILYFQRTIEQPLNKEYLHYIDYKPTKEDLIMHLNECTDNTLKYKKNIAENRDLLESFVSNLNEEEQIVFFYKNNFFEFITKNPKIAKLFETILRADIEFLDPYNIPEIVKQEAELLLKLIEVYVINPIPTHDRVRKFMTRKRKTIIVSDTDSLFVSFARQFKFFEDMITDVDFTEDLNMFKSINLMVAIACLVTEKHCEIICKTSNISEEFMANINMKNEFLFRSLLVFMNKKKNYIGDKVLREGTLVPEKGRMSITGALQSSSVNKEVKKMQDYIIYDLILKPKQVNMMAIHKAYDDLNNMIRDSILIKKNKNFGNHRRFGGESNYDNVESLSIARSAITWNRLYPNWRIETGDIFYSFKTKVETVEDAKKYITDPKMLEIVLDVVFDVNKRHNFKEIGQDFSRFGLKELGIPRSGNPIDIPQWMVDIIDVDEMIRLHTSNLVSLNPSLNFNRTKLGTKHMRSNLIKF